LGLYYYSSRIGSLYEGLKLNSRAAMFYNVVFTTRRLIFAVVVTMLTNYPTFQIFILILKCVLIIIYLALVRPFVEPSQNLLEIVNEIFIIAISYHMFVFTMFVPDSEI
jgi:hypothetical protein